MVRTYTRCLVYSSVFPEAIRLSPQSFEGYFMNNIFEDYHKNRTVLDTVFINHVFDTQDRDHLKHLQKLLPRSIIRMRNSDLIAKGTITGYGGSVPAEWDGSIVDLNQRFNV